MWARWSKERAREYHRGWRRDFSEHWKALKRAERMRRREERDADPLAHRKRYFDRIYGKPLRAKGESFAVTAADVEWPTHCPVYGFPLDYGFGYGKSQKRDHATLAKIDEKGGWEPGNVRFVSRWGRFYPTP